MSKWLDNFYEANRQKIYRRIEKLEKEYIAYDLEYRDRPWTKYLMAMEKREEEIDQLKLLADPKEMLRELERSKQECKNLRATLQKINILAEHIDPADRIGYENLKKLTSMSSSFTDSFVSEDFKTSAEKGVW